MKFWNVSLSEMENFLTRSMKVEKVVVCLGWLTQSYLVAMDQERFPATIEDELWSVVPKRWFLFSAGSPGCWSCRDSVVRELRGWSQIHRSLRYRDDQGWGRQVIVQGFPCQIWKSWGVHKAESRAGVDSFGIFKWMGLLETVEEMILNWPFLSPVLVSGLRTSSHALASITFKNLVNQERIMKESLLGTTSLTPRTNSPLMGHANRKMEESLSKWWHLLIFLLLT